MHARASHHYKMIDAEGDGSKQDEEDDDNEGDDVVPLHFECGFWLRFIRRLVCELWRGLCFRRSRWQQA